MKVPYPRDKAPVVWSGPTLVDWFRGAQACPLATSGTGRLSFEVQHACAWRNSSMKFATAIQYSNSRVQELKNCILASETESRLSSPFCVEQLSITVGISGTPNLGGRRRGAQGFFGAEGCRPAATSSASGWDRTGLVASLPSACGITVVVLGSIFPLFCLCGEDSGS